jgi:chaperonin cofactor prefoldin
MKAMRFFAMAALAIGAVAAAAPAAEETDVPLTHITSFRSGVAYFERNGDVTGDAEVQLKFKTDQINDILKSLVVMAEGQTSVTGVTYGSRDPLSRALQSFGVDISGRPTLGELLAQVRGAQVTVLTPAPVTGKILGVETKKVHVGDPDAVLEREILNLVTPEGIKSLKLADVSGVKLADEQLAAELNKALALLVESRDTNRKPVTIQFRGQGKRDVRIGYITEAPIWKTSYRLVLDPEKEEAGVFLQGWAIVENTSDHDWENVQLTLVAGRPISFVQDLYTPLYLPRPEVKPKLYSSLRPQVYGEGIDAERKLARLKARRRAPAADRADRGRAPLEAGPSALVARDQPQTKAESLDLTQGVSSLASAGDVGEMFRYRLKNKVTLPRRKSAMLPIINQAVDGRPVSIYNAQVLKKHPLNGLWLINDSDLTLLSGPVTVFQGGTYAGDARIPNLSPKDKRLISYAIDLKVVVDPSSRSSNTITAVRIVRGVLHVTRKYTYEQSYEIKNKAADRRTLVIEHPRRHDRELIEPDEPAEKTPEVYRFEVDVAAGQSGKFDVREERVSTQTIAILPADVGSLQWYSTSGKVPEDVREALSEAIRRKQALTQAQREVQELTERISKLRREQGYVRSNMKAVRSGSAAYQRFEKKLLDLETEIEKLQKQLDAAREKVDKLRKDLEDYLSKLSVE